MDVSKLSSSTMEPTSPVWTVMVDDNFHPLDQSERYELGKYASFAEAVLACKRIVDAFLTNEYKPGMTAEDLFYDYRIFGESPFILNSSDELDFCASDYAGVKSLEICGVALPA